MKIEIWVLNPGEFSRRTRAKKREYSQQTRHYLQHPASVSNQLLKFRAFVNLLNDFFDYCSDLL